MDDWEDITGLDAWSAKLQELMYAGQVAASSGNTEKIGAVVRRLREFRSNCQIPPCGELDRLAEQTLERLAQSTIADSLRILGEAATELDGLVRPLQGVTSAGNRSADWISLRTPTAIVDRLGETVDAVNSLYETTRELPGSDAIKTRIDSVVEALTNLQGEVRNAENG